MNRGCVTCEGYFSEETDEETLTVLRNHLERCTEDNPFTEDINIKGFI